MINILHVIRPADGGMKNHVISLLNSIDKTRFRAWVAGPNAHTWHLQQLDRRIKAIDFPLAGDIAPFSDLPLIFKLITLIKQNDIHIVHAHGMKAGLIGRLAGWLAGKPVVVTVHNSVYSYPMSKLKKHVIAGIQKVLARRTHSFITVSEALKKEVMAWEGVREDTVKVIYNGINSDHFRKDRRSFVKVRLGLDTKLSIIGTVARMAPQKGINHFVQAAALVTQIDKDCQFLVVGDGPLRKEAEDLSRSLGLGEKMIFSGYYPEIADIYPIIDIFVVPSLSEGLSITTIEAMAAGKPIVASATGGIPELISHRKTGLLVPPGDDRALAQGILELLKRPRWRQSMALAAQEKVLNGFSVDAMVEKTTNIYIKIANELGLETKSLEVLSCSSVES